MKNFRLLIVAIATSLFNLTFTLTPLAAQDTIRVMTININQGADNSLEEIGKYIKKYNPDLVALQEVDMRPNRHYVQHQKGKNFIAELSYYTDMVGVFGKAFSRPTNWDYGNAVLSKYSITKSEAIKLPNRHNYEPRVILLTTIDVNDKKVCFASVHLCVEDKATRAAQIKFIKRLMRKQKADYKFICGDFNSTPTEQLVSKNLKRWTDALDEDVKTFPAQGEALIKIDYILYEKKSHLEVINSEIKCEDTLSDHCSCLVDFIVK